MQKTTRKSRIMSSVELSAAEVEKEEEGDEDEEKDEEEEGDEDEEEEEDEDDEEDEEEDDDDEWMLVSPRFLHVCVLSHSKGTGP